MTSRLRMVLNSGGFPGKGHRRQRPAAWIAKARSEHGADLVVFPELAISGYPPEDLLLRPSFLAECEQALLGVAAEAAGIILADNEQTRAQEENDDCIYTANKESELADYSVCMTWGVKDKKYYLLHVLRKRMEYPELKRSVVKQAELATQLLE